MVLQPVAGEEQLEDREDEERPERDARPRRGPFVLVLFLALALVPVCASRRAVGRRAMSTDVMLDTAERIARQRASGEGKEGVGAFLEKREPAWRS